jgi:two-component system phosphate regulon response regulator OmpR
VASDLSPRAHLLVVDDDPRIRAMMARYFEGEGFRVSLAENGLQLRRHLEQLALDLNLLDLGFPDADGLALAREVRAQSEVGIIIVTARTDDIDRIVGLEVGADDYIVKPFNLREVLARVKSVLRRLQPAARAQSNDRRKPNRPAASRCFDSRVGNSIRSAAAWWIPTARRSP